MNKTDLIDRIAHANGLSRNATTAIVDSLFETMTGALQKGDSVMIRDFGTFDVVHRAERTGRNPLTGTTVTIPSRRAVTFRPSASIKSIVAVADGEIEAAA